METIHGLDTHGPAIIGTGVVFTVLTVVAVGLRFTSKPDVIGRRATSTEDDRYQTYLKYVYVYSVFYFPTISLAQTSILFLYRRLFYPSHLRYTCIYLVAICTAWCIAAMVIEIGFPGYPISYFFPAGPTTVFKVKYLPFWLAMALIETILEIIILLLPIREIHRLKLSMPKKYLLYLIFGLGGFVIITGIVRMAIIYHPNNPNFDLTQGDIWLNVHLGTAILSACLPTFRPLILRKERLQSSLSFGSVGNKGSFEEGRTSVLSAMKNRMSSGNGNARLTSKEDIVMQPQKENQGSFADARWSEGSNTPNTSLQEDGSVKTGEAIAVRKTVEVV